ncbi:XRE family transcriptional regulator [Amycolatopsis sp. cg5]|uniref:XRE family transcriptional regulator n=1 Tax=Amycolatopsis sp. cg5 TaxID=3238802 RepID=UPI0035253006
MTFRLAAGSVDRRSRGNYASREACLREADLLVENMLLRIARTQAASVQAPGEGVSRHELASRVNEYLWDRYRQRADLDANYVGKLERGVITWPNSRYREALRHVLNVANDSALGFQNTRRAYVTDKPSPGDSLTLLLADLDRPPSPRRVSRRHIDNVAHAAKAINAVHQSNGGSLMQEALMAELRYASRLLALPCHSDLEQPLHTVVAQLAHTAGFSAFDLGRHQAAARFFEFGLSCEQEGGNPHSRAFILASMSRLAAWNGKHEQGLAYADRALMDARELTHTELAMVHAARARSLAAMRDTSGALRALGKADDHFGASAPSNDPSWMTFYDYAQHCGDTGNALLNLSQSGHHVPAAFERLAEAGRVRDPLYARSHTLRRLLLATLTMTAGDPAEAVSLGSDAIDSAEGINSHLILDLLGGLSQAATAHEMNRHGLGAASFHEDDGHHAQALPARGP